MVKYVTNVKHKSLVFNTVKEFLDAYGKYGQYTFDGRPVIYSVYTDDIYEAAKLKYMQGSIYVVLKQTKLDEISSLVDDSSLSSSKYDRILDCINTNNIFVESSKVVSTLLKVLPNYDMEEELVDFANKYNRYITMESIKNEYIVDVSSHPINVVKSVLSGKPYKSILKNTRNLYNDKAIRTSMLNHLRTAMDKRYKFSIENSEYDNLAYFSIDYITELYVSMHMFKSIDIAIMTYKNHRRSISYEY